MAARAGRPPCARACSPRVPSVKQLGLEACAVQVAVEAAPVYSARTTHCLPAPSHGHAPEAAAAYSARTAHGLPVATPMALRGSPPQATRQGSSVQAEVVRQSSLSYFPTVTSASEFERPAGSPTLTPVSSAVYLGKVAALQTGPSWSYMPAPAGPSVAVAAYPRHASPGPKAVRSYQPAPVAAPMTTAPCSARAAPSAAGSPEPVALRRLAASPSQVETVAVQALPTEAVVREAVVREAVVREAVVREAVVREAPVLVQAHPQAQSQAKLEPVGSQVRAAAVVSAREEPEAHARRVAHPAVHRQQTSTPREALERDLTEPEKVQYSDLDFVESLGSGEFGQVFRGVYKGEEVAIKHLYWDDTVSERVMRDLAKEIEAFRSLRHKRLVRFIGACLEMPHLCLVTEYMPGGSLHHLLHVRKQQLPLLHATNMCLQIADGVMYLHSQNPIIVHRDLKSLNVVLDLSLNCKICDFGLTEPMERTHFTKRSNGGSPRYMAPELFDSKTKITEKIDLWAMACVFIEIYGGSVPYKSISTLADLTREMLVHRRKPSIPRVIPEEVRQIIASCLHFDYRMRPKCKHVFEQLKMAKKQLREAGLL